MRNLILMHLMTTKPSRGFTLLEILIALLILSVGLLGLAGLQVNGLHSNQDSYYLTQAMAQAYDMADRMRANRVGYTAGSYDNIDTTTPTDPGCITTGCSSANMAVYDRYQWNTANANVLPSGKGSVTTSGNIRIITVMWDQLRNGVLGTACSGDPTKDLTCFKTSFQP
ncbi:MAG: type IV pilus modification protein PilV [Gammaproteobacteria bacterium]